MNVYGSTTQGGTCQKTNSAQCCICCESAKASILLEFKLVLVKLIWLVHTIGMDSCMDAENQK